jgi:hypothetical protein
VRVLPRHVQDARPGHDEDDPAGLRGEADPRQQQPRRAGVPVPALEPVDDILRALEGLARAARLEGFESSLDAIGALAVAARLAHARAEAVSVTSGDAVA